MRQNFEWLIPLHSFESGTRLGNKFASGMEDRIVIRTQISILSQSCGMIR